MGFLSGEKLILGYDLGNEFCQISYAVSETGDVETLSQVAGEQNYNIPAVLCKRIGVNQWFYGKEALRYAEGQNGILVKAKKVDGTVLDPANMPEATANYEGIITFPVKANTDYYVYVTGSKLGFYGFTFTPITLYTVTFNAGTNGTCSTTSSRKNMLTQASLCQK